MSKLDGGSAYPVPQNPYTPTVQTGMSLRDHFASFAMQGLIVADTQWSINPKDLATMAYERADAMLKERRNIFPKQ